MKGEGREYGKQNWERWTRPGPGGSLTPPRHLFVTHPSLLYSKQQISPERLALH